MSYLVAKETIPLLKRETVTDFWLLYQELSHGNVCMSLSSPSLKQRKAGSQKRPCRRNIYRLVELSRAITRTLAGQDS